MKHTTCCLRKSLSRPWNARPIPRVSGQVFHEAALWIKFFALIKRYSCTMLVPKLLEICQISVRNLSENSQLQNSVRYLSELCQMTVRNQSVANICQNSIRKDLEIHQKCVRFYKSVRKLSVLYLENCLKSVRIISSDWFLTHLPNRWAWFSPNLHNCFAKICLMVGCYGLRER